MLRAFLAESHDAAPNPLIPADYDIIWSGVIFVALLLVFALLVVPRLNTVLDERRAAIEGGIEKAQAAQAEADAVLEKYNAQLAEARAEAAQIREQARADGAKILAELKEQAQAEANRITQNAQVQIEAEKAAALVALRAEVGSLALDLASGVIGESLADDARSAAIVDRFLADLESAETASKG